MKKYLFKNARIADPNSKWNGKKADVYVSDGKIKRIGKDLKNRVKTIDLKGCYLLPGFCDLYADFCDPGFEHREDINSGIRAAAAGGYTKISIIPSTNPVNQNKSAIEYALHRSEHQLVTVYPMGAVSEDMKGEQPTEMYDMHEAGAVGFTDAPHSIKSSGLLLRALQYVQAFGGIVLDMSTDESLSNGGHINEGEVSVRMGLKGIPHMAEVVHIKRNIEILRYTGGCLHIYGITTRDGVDLIRQAKRDGLNITASVFAHHLLYTEADVSTFNANLKVHPPLRTERDRKALITGLKRGIIDCIVSQHTPLETEEKKTEFEYAAFGMTGLETVYSTLIAVFGKDLNYANLASWLSIRPRQIINLPIATIEEGAQADFTALDPKLEWEYSGKTVQSKSCNSPWYKQTLKGRARGVCHRGKWSGEA